MDISRLLNDEQIEAELPFGDAFVTIRYVPRTELLAINRKATKLGWNAAHQPEEKTDQALANALLVKATVVGWRNMGVEFSPEAAVALSEKMTDFWRFINEACSDFQRLVEAEQKAAKKKS